MRALKEHSVGLEGHNTHLGLEGHNAHLAASSGVLLRSHQPCSGNCVMCPPNRSPEPHVSPEPPACLSPIERRADPALLAVILVPFIACTAAQNQVDDAWRGRCRARGDARRRAEPDPT
jgi:hypothetical protein